MIGEESSDGEIFTPPDILDAASALTGDQYLWRQVFFLAAGFYLVTNLIYVLFGTCEKAECNDFPEIEDVEENLPMMNKTKQ